MIGLLSTLRIALSAFNSFIPSGFRSPNLPPLPVLAAVLLLFSTVVLSSALSHAADVQISQFDDSPDPAVRGGDLTYTLNVENNAADTAGNVVLTVPLPATTIFISATGSGCTHDGGSPGTVTCALGNLLGTLVGGPVTKVTVTVRTSAATGAVLDASSSVVTTSPDTNPANNTAAQTTTINDGADLGVGKSGSPGTVVAGGLVDWTLSARNLGPDDAESVTITDTLPGTMAYVSTVSASGWSCGVSGQVVTCTRATAAAGSLLPDVVIRARITGAVTGTVINAATISSASISDPFPANNTTTGGVTVTTGADLSVGKSVSPSPAIGGQNATFTVRPRNSGPFVAASVTVSDTLPDGFTFVSASGPGWSCSAAGQVVTCTRPDYAVSAVDDISITALAPSVTQSTSFNNIAGISSSTPDPDSANNTSSLAFSVVADGRDLALTKTKTPNPVAQNAMITSRLVALNNGPRDAPAGSVRVTDTLNLAAEAYGYPQPTPTVFFSGAGWTCSLSGSVVTCDYASALAAGSTATVDVFTTALAAGVLTNDACAVYTGAAPGDSVSANDCVSASVISTEQPVSPDLSITKSATTANGDTTLADTEETVTYTVTVTNNGPGDATGMVLTDTIPGYVSPSPGNTGISVSVATPSSAVFSCTTGSTVTCTQTGGVLPQGQNAVFTIAVARPLSSGVLNNTARITSATLGDPNSANNQATASVTVSPNADVEVVSKSVSPSTVQAGTNAVYVITVRNNGPSAASSVQLVDSVCTGSSTDCDYTFVSASATGGGSCSHNAGLHTVTCDWPALTNGQSEAVTLTLMPNWQAGNSVRRFENTAVISTTTREKHDGSDWGNNSQTATLTINPASLDMVVNKTDNSPAGPDPLGYTPSPTGNENQIAYRIAITNRGPSLGTGVQFTDTITPPSGRRVTFMGVSDSAFGAASGSTSCTNIGVTSGAGSPLSTTCSLVAGVSASSSVDRYLMFRVEDPPASGGETYSDSVTVSANETDSNLINNTEGETTTVRVRADLSVAKSPSPATVQIREPFLWTISVTNSGPGDSQQTGLTDTLPSGMQFITPAAAGSMPAPYNAPPFSSGAAWSSSNSTPTSGSCSVSGSSISCNFGLLENGRVVTLTVPVRMTSFPGSGTTAQNCATATTGEVDPTTTNNTGCGNVTVQRSRIAGVVYRDNNDNGAQDSGETGINGVSLRLTGTDIYGSTVNTTTTASNGIFTFSNLSPADSTGYTITETQPPGFFDGREAAGTSGGNVDNSGFGSGAVYNQITGIVLAANTNATGYLFGELAANTISGSVYVDTNNNGVLNGGESIIGGVTITLTGTDDLGASVNVTTTTGSGGSYQFTNLRTGTYTVMEAQPAAYLDGRDTAGTVGGSPCSGCDTSVNDQISNIVLTQFGTNALNMNFGELAASSLTGSVYIDSNGSGGRNTGEPGISGTTVQLTGTDDLGAPVSLTTTTDSNGDYQFAALRPGTYTITEPVQPAGYADGAETAGTLGGSTAVNESISSITVGSGQNGTGYNFGELGVGLSGSVYVDSNNNGVRDSGERPISGVTITLSGTDSAGRSMSRTTTTAADGTYSFTGLPASNSAGYTVTETQPSGYLDGLDSAGTAGGSVSNDVISSIVLTGVTLATGYNFGERGAELSGTVYIDANGSSIQDSGEPGIPNVTVRLTGTDSAGVSVNVTTTTDVNGDYRFSDLRGGTYTLTETQPANYADGAETVGTLGGTNSTNDVMSGINVTGGATGTGYNFGELGVSLAGTVYVDSNNNGIRDAGESGIAGTTVTLTGTDNAGNAVSRTTTTAADGSYSFTHLPGSNATGYTVTETQPPGYTDGLDRVGTAGGALGNDVISQVVLTGSTAATGYDFGERGGELSGSVYVDSNGNGTRDTGEPGLPGVTVTLTGTDNLGNPVTRTTTTDANGDYRFTDLRAGDYTLTETQPVGFTDGAETVGSLGGSTAVNDSISSISLGAGQSGTGYNFGEVGVGLAGSAYIDSNNNGARDAGEPGIGGVLITLTGTDGAGNAVNRTTTTAADGTYSILNLAASDPAGYRITETQPAGYGDGRDRVGTGGGTLGNDTVSNIVLSGTTVVTGYDFGELGPELSGSVYIDTNGNGTRDNGEPGIAGVTVALTGTDVVSGAVSRTTTTDANGAYRFSDLRAGSYTITETQPLGFADGAETVGSLGGDNSVNDVFSSLTVGAGQNGTGYDFGERGVGLSGTVYVDSNNNGSRDSTETGIAGVLITLTGTDSAGNAVTRTATTVADGSYSFVNLPASNGSGYTITETQPAAWADGQDRAGTAGGTAGNDVIGGVVLGGTTAASGYDFGERGGGLSGFVYVDSNYNGLKESGEAPIQGVTITLTGTDTGGTAVSRTTSTAADGSYSFADLPLPGAGGYTLAEVQPQNFGDGLETVGSLGGTVSNDRFSAIPITSANLTGTSYNFGERLMTPAQVSGRVWFDANHDRIDNDGQGVGRAGWTVELIRRPDPFSTTFTMVAQATTEAQGGYSFANVTPNFPPDPTDRYEIRFRHPQNGIVMGMPVSAHPGAVLTYGTIRDLSLNPGDNVINQDLPLDPGGVVYDSVTRNPVAGATVELSGPSGFNPAVHLVGGLANRSQVTTTDGVYQFLLLRGAPAGEYAITVTPPTGYLPFPSNTIAPCTATLAVGSSPNPLLIQTSGTAPGASAPFHDPDACSPSSAGVSAGAASTQYYLRFSLVPGQSVNTLNNHIPIDPFLASGAIKVTKTTPMVNVRRGELVPYTITATNTLKYALTNITLHDRMPPGFKYRQGSGTLNGKKVEPVVEGRELLWKNLTFAAGEKKTITFVLVVGTGVGEGEYTNLAWAFSQLTNNNVSNIASAKVRIVPDAVFDCPDVIGKVFDDKNSNGYPDEGEPGLANVRLSTVRGLLINTDSEGRFHVPCPELPDADRGANFVLKLDERTLPTGYRVTTENPLVARITRGKLIKMNFGASVLRVVRIEVHDGAFTPGGTELREQWKKQLEGLQAQLRDQPAVVRIAYRTGGEPRSLVDKRLDSLRQLISSHWRTEKNRYTLVFEEEIVTGR